MLDLFRLNWFSSRSKRNTNRKACRESIENRQNTVTTTTTATVKRTPQNYILPLYESLSEYSVTDDDPTGWLSEKEYYSCDKDGIHGDYDSGAEMWGAESEPKLVLVLYCSDIRFEQYQLEAFDIHCFEIRFINIETEHNKVNAIVQHLDDCRPSPVQFCLLVTHQLANLFCQATSNNESVGQLLEQFRIRDDLKLQCLYTDDNELSAFRLKYRLSQYCRFVGLHNPINVECSTVSTAEHQTTTLSRQIVRAAIQLNNENVCRQYCQHAAVLFTEKTIVPEENSVTNVANNIAGRCSTTSSPVNANKTTMSISSQRQQSIPTSLLCCSSQAQFNIQHIASHHLCPEPPFAWNTAPSLTNEYQTKECFHHEKPLFEVFPRQLYLPSDGNGQVLIRLCSNALTNCHKAATKFQTRKNTLAFEGQFPAAGAVDVLVNGQSTFDLIELQWKNNIAFMFTLPEHSWKNENGTMSLSVVVDYRHCLGTIQLQRIEPPSKTTVNSSQHQNNFALATEQQKQSSEHRSRSRKQQILPEADGEQFDGESLFDTEQFLSTIQSDSGGLGRELLSQIGSKQFLGSVLAVNSLDELDTGLVSEFCRNPAAWKHFYQVELGQCSLPTWLHFAAHYGLYRLTAELLKLPNARRVVQMSTAGVHRRPIDLAIRAGHWPIVQALIEFEREQNPPRHGEDEHGEEEQGEDETRATRHRTTVSRCEMRLMTENCASRTSPNRASMSVLNKSKIKPETENETVNGTISRTCSHDNGTSKSPSINRDFIESHVNSVTDRYNHTPGKGANKKKSPNEEMSRSVGKDDKYDLYGCDYNLRISAAETALLYLIEQFKAGMPIKSFERRFTQWESDYEDVLVTQLLNDEFYHSLNEIRKLCHQNRHS